MEIPDSFVALRVQPTGPEVQGRKKGMLPPLGRRVSRKKISRAETQVFFSKLKPGRFAFLRIGFRRDPLG
jgi:hypothetical protein